MAESFVLTCPCCNGRLTVDPDLKAVIAHEAPPRPKSGADLNNMLSSLKGEAARRDQLFKEQMEAEKNRGKVLDRKFQESVKKAKDMPDEKPLNPMDQD